jgi:hypothetical protein
MECPSGKLASLEVNNVLDSCTALCNPGAVWIGQVCSNCSFGTFADYDSCSLCEKGKFSSRKANDECDSCPKGSYNYKRGQSSCVPCANFSLR